MHKLIYSLALLWLVQGLAAQQDYAIALQSGILLTAEDLPSDSVRSSFLAPHQFEGYYHLVLQFPDLPTPEKVNELAALGITLENYLPNYAFLAKVPTNVNWAQVQARAVLPLQPGHKLSKALAEADFSLQDTGMTVKVYPFPDISLPVLVESLKQSGFAGRIQGNGVMVTVASCCLLDLAGNPTVLFIENQEIKPRAEGWVGRTAQRLNLVSGGPGLGFDGSGVAIAIGDDGKASHEDFKGRITDFNSADNGNHGEMTAGLAMGAGNLNPLGMGMAPGAYLYMYPIDNYIHLDNAVANLQQYNTVITSTSYGEGCGGIYTQGAQSMDKQVYQNEALLHVFSAGNSGEEVCSSFSNYRASDGGRFGTITGGRKAGKNVITVGNTAYDDRMIVNSSRGPTADGRIKPEICANGQGNLSTDANNGYRSGGGTSAAAPSLAGTAAALYQAYREKNGGANPASALIKAVLLNTADDLGNPGPDYVSGFGRVNAGKALETLQNNWYSMGSVTNGATKTHSISVPAGTQQLRVMLYWHDPEGLPNAAKSLVNDLDIKLSTPNGETYLPWVLSRAINGDSLNKSAYRGVDRVNNVEQITLDLPDAGDYNISVKGNMVPKGPQKYYLVYSFVKEALKLTYPNGGEGFVPGETEVIRWDAMGNTGTFSLEYSIDNGNNWTTIATNINGNFRQYDWQVPNISATQARVRLSRDGKKVISAAPFCMLGLPDFNITPTSDNTATIRWRKVPGADRYDVYALGNQYMQVIGTVSDTSFQFNTGAGQSNWYSVRARHSNGAVGRRAFAQFYQHQVCEANLILQLTFDFYPSETSWDIQDADGKIWASGGPYNNAPISSSTKIDICLPYGCYIFNMRDAYNDGMCCNYGEGSFKLLDANNRVLATGGAFGKVSSHNICLQSNINANLKVEVTSKKNVSCAGARDGSIAVAASGGSGNYTYRWNTGLTTPALSELAAGTYTVTVTDRVQQVFANVTLTQPSPLETQLSVQQSDCFQTNNNAITAIVSGGTSPYRYTWNDGSHNNILTNVHAGTYEVTVMDANSCTTNAKTTIQNTVTLTTSTHSTNPSCANSNDGKASVVASGGVPPYKYLWNNGSTSASVTGLSTGTYSVTVTDSKGCDNINTINLQAPAPIALTFSTTQAVGTNNGSIHLRVSGGSPAYQFQWSNGATTQDLNNLGPGTYIVTVTDSNGCTAVGLQRIDFQEMTNCIARGSNTRFEWIQQIQFNNFINNSGNDNGYGNFLNLTPAVQRGSNAVVILSPGYTAAAFHEYWRIWIDFNQDGDFLDEGEEVLAADGIAGDLTATISIPNTALPGSTQMRVSMRYGEAASACGTFPYGEVEDYSLFITTVNNFDSTITNRSDEDQNFTATTLVQLYPNPTKLRFFIKFTSTISNQIKLHIYNLNGILLKKHIIPIQKGVNIIEISVKDLPPGTYVVRGEGEKLNFVERLILLE